MARSLRRRVVRRLASSISCIERDPCVRRCSSRYYITASNCGWAVSTVESGTQRVTYCSRAYRVAGTLRRCATNNLSVFDKISCFLNTAARRPQATYVALPHELPLNQRLLSSLHVLPALCVAAQRSSRPKQPPSGPTSPTSSPAAPASRASAPTRINIAKQIAAAARGPPSRNKR